MAVLVMWGALAAVRANGEVRPQLPERQDLVNGTELEKRNHPPLEVATTTCPTLAGTPSQSTQAPDLPWQVREQRFLLNVRIQEFVGLTSCLFEEPSRRKRCCSRTTSDLDFVPSQGFTPKQRVHLEFVAHDSWCNRIIHEKAPDAVFTLMVSGTIGGIIGIYLSVPLAATLRGVCRSFTSSASPARRSRQRTARAELNL